jgi:hypothetical protein
MKDAKGHGSEAHQTGVNQVGSGPHQIVYARAEKTALEPTGRTITRDRNQVPEFRAAWEGRAGMWLNKGTDADVEKAQKALKAEGYTIHTYPQTERDPLGKARATVVQKAKSIEN